MIEFCVHLILDEKEKFKDRVRQHVLLSENSLTCKLTRPSLRTETKLKPKN